MPKILVNLSEKEDRIVDIYKLVNNLKTKQDAIKEMIEYFEAEISPKNLKREEFFK